MGWSEACEYPREAVPRGPDELRVAYRDDGSVLVGGTEQTDDCEHRSGAGDGMRTRAIRPVDRSEALDRVRGIDDGPGRRPVRPAILGKPVLDRDVEPEGRDSHAPRRRHGQPIRRIRPGLLHTRTVRIR